MENLEKISKTDPKNFWQTINSLGCKKSDIPMAVYKNGILSSDPKDVLHKWETDFTKLYNTSINDFDEYFLHTIKKLNRETELNMKAMNNQNILLNCDISYDEVEAQINKSKLNKSVGFDNIPNEVLKHPDCIMLLYRLFKLCFDKSLVPSAWLKAVISPMPKGADKDPYCPLSYRAVSLLSCVSKIYTGILNSRIVQYLNIMEFLGDEQMGFRKGKSCEDQVYNLTSIIQHRLSKNKDTYAAFIDMAKAFDCVNRELLLNKLLQFNIDGKIYFAIKALYSDTMNCVRLNGHFTGWFQSLLGVRQGDTLSPTLFNIFINDLIYEMNKLNLGIAIGEKRISLLLYADDIVLLAESEHDLQSMLNCLLAWCQKWRLSVNDAKSEIIHFRGVKKAVTQSEFKIGTKPLKVVSKYKYLGIILDEHLKFEQCAEMLASSAGRALAKMISKFKTYKSLTFNTFTKLYDSCIWPILDYCSTIWSHRNFKFADKVQNRAIRYFLGLHRNAPTLGLQAEMGWMIPKYRYYISNLRFWNRLCCTNNTLTRHIFEWNIQNYSNNCWESHINEIFNDLDIGDYFENGLEVNLVQLTEKVLTLMHEEWQSKIPYKPKLRTFSLFKQDMETEAYIKTYSKSKRSILCQLRIGILPLEIELGRYVRLKINERTCKLYKKDVEDEIHFVCVCLALELIRMKYFKILNIDKSELLIDQLSRVLTHMNVNMVINFIFDLWQERKSKLYC